MKVQRKPWVIWMAAGVALVLAACDNRPLEKAGRAVDRAAEKVGDTIREIPK